jgi:acetylornithine deacetylase
VNPARLQTLFRDLIDAYTPTGKEQEAIGILQAFFGKAGIPTILQQVDEDRSNLLVLPQGQAEGLGDGRANGSEPTMLFLCHVDTVAAPDWESWYWIQHGDRVEGLGASDMKSGCAAVAEAYVSMMEQRALAASSVPTDGGSVPTTGSSVPTTGSSVPMAGGLPIALAFVVGEEEDGAGTARLMEDWRFPLAVVAEPTDLRPCLSHYGYVEAKVLAQGRRVHASVAPLGVSPVAELLRFLLAAIDHFKGRGDGVIYNYRDLSSSPSGFAVPDWCEAWIDLHLPPDVAPAPLIYDLEELLEAQKRERTNLDAKLSFTTVHEGYDLPARGSFWDWARESFAKAGLPFQPDSFRSHSDASLLWHEGTRAMILGPGRLEEAHRSGEGVSWKQVCDAAQLYEIMMMGSGKLGE